MERMTKTEMTGYLIVVVLAWIGRVGGAEEGKLESLSTYKVKYGETKGAVEVNAETDLPRYPAVDAAEAEGTWQVKEGFKMVLAAHEPQVRDPIAICFDERGRMFVCEMNDYSEMRDVSPHLGRVSMLEDKDGDGSFESSLVFADDLPWPTGLIWANGGLYVGATPDIWRFEDRDGDGQAEVRERVFTGFGTGLKLLNVQGLMNSFQWGQDNRVHVLAGGGNRGKVKRLTAGGVAGTPVEVELGGRDFWFDPVTLEFGLEGGGAQYGMSFDDEGRKFGCSNSDHLQHWVYDDRYAARNPFFSMQPSRQSIAADGGAAEVFRISPDEPWRILRTRWRVAGVVKGVVEGGGRVSGYFTGATGTTIYRGDAYGPEFVGNSFTGDAGGQLIHRKVIRRSDDGVSLIGERPADEAGFEFAASRDTWVRAVNFANAPDGCLYVCDMYREVIEHPWSIPDEIKQHIDLNSGSDRGRIYRIERTGWDAAPGMRGRGNVAGADTAELVTMLGHANGWHRDTAQRLLYERQDDSAAVGLREVLEGGHGLAKLHALGVLSGMKALRVEDLKRCLGDEDARVQERACALSEHFLEEHPEAVDLLIPGILRVAEGGEMRARFQSLLTLGSIAGRGWGKHPDAIDEAILRTFAQCWEGGDGKTWLQHAVASAPPDVVAWTLDFILRTMEPTEEAWLSWVPLVGVVARRDSAEDRARLCREIAGAPEAVQAVLLSAAAEGFKRSGLRLEEADAAGALDAVMTKALERAGDHRLSERERVAAMEVLAFTEDKRAGETLLGCLSKDETDGIHSAVVRVLGSHAKAVPLSQVLEAWSELKAGARSLVLDRAVTSERDARVLVAVMSSGEAGKVPAPSDFSAVQVQTLLKFKASGLAEEVTRVFASVIPLSREEVAEKYAPAVELRGDAARGRNHYIGRCMACHRAEGMGMALGPDLVTVKTRGREGLLEAILNPHKEVAPQFIAYTVTAKDGRVATGAITRDDATGVTVKAMGGLEHSFARAEILGSSSAGQSLMPEGLETGMTVEDMADLLRFLEEL